MTEYYAKLVVSFVPEYWGNTHEEFHTSSGSLYSYNRRFVNEFDRDKKLVVFTNDEDKALIFNNDNICTECMEVIRDVYNPFTIALWQYDANSGDRILLVVKYPNDHWTSNGRLCPSLMNMTLDEWHEQHKR